MDIKSRDELIEYKFKIGDEVITTEGVRGKIIDICDCSSCRERGFFEPTWVRDDNEYDKQFITLFDALYGFPEYYKIGDYRFNDFDRMGVIHEIGALQDEMHRLKSQLKFMEDMMGLEKEKWGMDNLKLSLEKLNNPPQEVIDKRNKFFAECVELGEDVKWPHNDNTLEKLKKALYGFTRADIYKQYGYLEAKIHALEIVSGMTLDELLDKFAAGWVMVPTMPNGYFFDEELVKRHRDDSIDVLRYYPILSDPLLRTDAIVKLKFEDEKED